MGYDTTRIVSPIPEELICPICNDVLKRPTQPVAGCDHVFCFKCIEQWLENGSQSTCPMDRTSLQLDQLVPVHRLINSLINKLVIRCDKCPLLIEIGQYSQHSASCAKNGLNQIVENLEQNEQTLVDSVLTQSAKLSQEHLERERTFKAEIKLLRTQLSNTYPSFSRSVSSPTFSTTSKVVADELRLPVGGQVSLEHLTLIRRLRSEGYIYEERLFNAINQLDFELFFKIDPYHWRRAISIATILQACSPRVWTSSRVLVADTGYKYIPACLSLLINPALNGLVVSAGSEQFSRTVQNANCSIKDRLKIISCSDANVQRQGCPSFAPYDMVVISKNFFDKKLRDQLRAGGYAFDPFLNQLI